MSVYVDSLIDYGWKLGPSCHMIADTLEELNEMVLKIGMKLSWLQQSKGGLYHYDLVKSRRIRAIQNGAIEITRREFSEKFLTNLKKLAD